MKAALTLRIDVDFPQLTSDTVPVLLQALDQYGLRATFFIAAAASRPGSLLRRMRNVSYIRRILRLGSGRSLMKMLLDMRAQRGTSPELSALIRRIQQEGHEVAVHGYHHVWWADRVWVATPEEIEAEIEKAYAYFHSLAGTVSLAWASPGWRSTDRVMKLLQGRGVPYFSECWGRGPFLTRLDDGSVIRTPHLPVTLPCLESLRIVDGLGPEQAAKKVISLLKPDGYNMLCAHDYFEGMLGKDYFLAFLERCRECSIQTETAAATAERLSAEQPVCPLIRRAVSGFDGLVSFQGEPS